MVTVQLTVTRLFSEQQLQDFVSMIQQLDLLMVRLERQLDTVSPDATELPSERDMLRMRTVVEAMVQIKTRIPPFIQLEGHPSFDRARALTTRTRRHEFA